MQNVSVTTRPVPSLCWLTSFAEPVQLWNEPRNLQSRFAGRAQVRLRDSVLHFLRSELSELGELGELVLEAMRGHSWTSRMRCPGERVRQKQRCHCHRHIVVHPVYFQGVELVLTVPPSDAENLYEFVRLCDGVGMGRNGKRGQYLVGIPNVLEAQECRNPSKASKKKLLPLRTSHLTFQS